MANVPNEYLGMIAETHAICGKLDRTVNGNGQRGLVERVTSLEAVQKNCLRGQVEKKMDWRWWLVFIFMVVNLVIGLYW